MNDRVKRFIYFAKEDMISAKILLKEGIYNQACFHCQQAAEKTLKSFVKSKKSLAPKTHNLTELLKICTEYEKEQVSIPARISCISAGTRPLSRVSGFRF